MTQPTAAAVLEALHAEPPEQIAPNHRERLERFLTPEQLGNLLVEYEDLLEQPFTLAAFWQAIIRTCTFYLEHGFAEQIATHPMREAPLVEATLRQQMRNIELPLQDIEAYLSRQGISERDHLFDPRVGINQAVQELYLAGELTLAKLLLIQPSIVLFR